MREEPWNRYPPGMNSLDPDPVVMPGDEEHGKWDLAVMILLAVLVLGTALLAEWLITT